MFLGVPHEEVSGQDRQPYRPHPGRDGRGKGARVEKVRGCNKNKTASRQLVPYRSVLWIRIRLDLHHSAGTGSRSASKHADLDPDLYPFIMPKV
jgi:hypothetical protein